MQRYVLTRECATVKSAEKMSCYLCVRVVNQSGASLLPHDADVCSVDAHETFAGLYNRIAPATVKERHGLLVQAVQLRSEREADSRRTNEIKDVQMNVHGVLKMVRNCNGFDAQLLTFVVGSAAGSSGCGSGRSRPDEAGVPEQNEVDGTYFKIVLYLSDAVMICVPFAASGLTEEVNSANHSCRSRGFHRARRSYAGRGFPVEHFQV